MIRRRGASFIVWALIVSLATGVLTACGSQGALQTVVPNIQAESATVVKQGIGLGMGAFSLVPNKFGAATGQQLTNDQVDGYIDQSVTGADRTLLHRLLSKEVAPL